MKILYVMHVNWNWIRQRPHVLADQLAEHHDVMLLHYAMYRGSHRVAEDPPRFVAHELVRVPERIKRLGAVFERFNTGWLARQVRRHVLTFRPDLVWITHPELEPAVRDIGSASLVFDCMDDHVAFNATTAEAVLAAERRLVKRAHLTIFSSQTLAQRVGQRSAVRCSEVVNNGLADELLAQTRANPVLRPKVDPVSPGPTMGYFGTLSNWFDWPLVLHLLDAMPQARLALAGPIETTIPEHPRIRHVGLLPHAALANFASDCDVLVMPFALNALIEAVDPVKLYEYIALNLPALAPRYPESSRFEPWVSLYSNVDAAIDITRRITAPEFLAPPHAQRLQFLETNTWAARGMQIERALQRLRAA